MLETTSPSLDFSEQVIIEAIHLNYKQLLNSQMLTHYGSYLKRSDPPEKIYSLIEKINDVRLLSNPYLNRLIQQPKHPLSATLESETSGWWYYLDRISLIIPDDIKNFFTDLNHSFSELNVLHGLTSEILSINLDNSLTEVLFDYFKNQYKGNQEEAQRQFNETLEKQVGLSQLIKKECEQISVELIKLFHFREMLLLGKMSRDADEPDSRKELINRANLKSNHNVSLAIEIYFIQELSMIFNNGFRFLYQVHDMEIQSELQSPLIKWINQLSESNDERQEFTQDIQLKFMLLTRDFLLKQMNELGFLAKHPIVFSLIVGFIVAIAIIIITSLTLGAMLLWGVGPLAAVGFFLAAIATYTLINQWNLITYKRSKANRDQIQNATYMINEEYLRLKKDLIDSKNTSDEFIKNTRDFNKINRQFLHSNKVARGSISGWLREYAARYRHSKAIEVDLGDEYRKLIIQSRTQTEKLIKGKVKHWKTWIECTRNYLKDPQRQDITLEFELRQKIKEQILTLISTMDSIDDIQPELLKFYCDSEDAGGLEGNATDFSHIRAFAKNIKESNPYHFLCKTALNLHQMCEPYYAVSPLFRGDPEYRYMLGITTKASEPPVNPENIEDYLNHSYWFLLSLCNKVTPGLGLDPLQQPAGVSPEFILYRMLLLKQLATLCMSENKEIETEVKLKIKGFVKDRFSLDPEVIFDDLVNQRFLLNREPHPPFYYNSNQVEVTEAELDNILQAIILDVAYNSLNFKLIDVLNKEMDVFLHSNHRVPRTLFAYNRSEQEINPQGSVQFLEVITQYCQNTHDFLEHYSNIKALKANNMLECYKYNVSLQVYKTQLRIIKNIKELARLKEDEDEPIILLLNAFKTLHQFAKTNCFSLKKETPCAQLFQCVLSKSQGFDSSKHWIKYLDSAESLKDFMINLPKQIQYPETQAKEKLPFFNVKRPSKSDNSFTDHATADVINKTMIKDT